MTGLLSFDPSQIHTVSPSNLPISIQFFCSDRTWRSKILAMPPVLSVADPGGISAAGQAAGEICLYRKEFRENVRQIFYHSRGEGKRLAGNHGYPAAPWRAVQDERKFLGRHGSGHCQQPQYVPTPFSMCWSYLLSNSKRFINTPSETAAGRVLFRDGMRQRRCLIPASNYVEWERNDSGKVKYAIRPRQSGLMYMAHGQHFTASPAGEASSPYPGLVEEIRFIHDRMPVLFCKERAGA